MPITINGSGSITGISAGGLPDGVIVADDIASGAVAPAKLSTGAPSWDSSGNLSFNSGYGSVATAYGCRAWVNFNGTGTVAIRASGNVSSITDEGTGLYRINFSINMPDGNYSVVAIASSDATSSVMVGIEANAANVTTSSVRIRPWNSSGEVDRSVMCAAIFR